MDVASVAVELCLYLLWLRPSLSLSLGLELGLDEGVPGEFISAEVGDKVVEGFQAGLKEGEERVAAQEADGQRPPLLDAE